MENSPGKPTEKNNSGQLGQGWPALGLALAFFALATVAFTWPLTIKLWDYLPDWGDPPDVAWKLGYIARNLLHNPLNLNQNPYFYPLTDSIALNELLTGLGILGAPVYWLTGNTTLVFNLLNFGSFWLSGFSMWLLVRHLTGSFGAGIGAGLVYAFSPWHYGQYGHLPLTAQQWMIFSLYGLVRFLESPVARPRSKRHWLWLAFFVFFFVLQALCAGYYAYFEAILVGCYLAYFFLFRSGLVWQGWHFLRRKMGEKPEWRRLGVQLGWIAGAGVVAFLLILPAILPSMHYQQEFGFKRQISEINYWSAAPNSLLRMSAQSWLYKPIERGLFNLQTSAEREMYPGLFTVVLVVAGAIGALRKKQYIYWVFLAVALIGLVLSLGPSLNLEAYGLQPTGITLPYKWLYDLVPGFSVLRVAGRFAQLLMLGLAVCAGFGLTWLAGLKPRFLKGKIQAAWKPALQTGLVALVAIEFFAPGLPAQPTPTGAAAPPLYRWLASPEADKIIGPQDLLLELPMDTQPTPITSSPIYLFYGLDHQRPMLNGSANILPAGYDRLYYEMQSFPAPATLDIIEGLGVKFVIVHTANLAADANRAELEKQAGPGGRLELVQGYPSTDGRFKDAVYRVKPDLQRFQPLASLIPAGSNVLLADTNSHRRLYTYILAALLGADKHYFAPFSTVYAGMVGGVGPIQPGQKFDYAIFYKSGGPNPADYGFTPADLVPLPPGDFDTLALYHKK
ncbi:MAG: hypothetical protein J0I20_03170 [Chloroflexi bacterium]|nr:hypothetical protein [Chloroflexota bacterium]